MFVFVQRFVSCCRIWTDCILTRHGPNLTFCPFLSPVSAMFVEVISYSRLQILICSIFKNIRSVSDLLPNLNATWIRFGGKKSRFVLFGQSLMSKKTSDLICFCLQCKRSLEVLDFWIWTPVFIDLQGRVNTFGNTVYSWVKSTKRQSACIFQSQF